MASRRFFPTEEYGLRLGRVRKAMAERGLDALLVSAPENVYYLTGLDHQGYFAFHLLIVPLEGRPILVTRAMERATVHDLAPDVRHVGYTDGNAPLPPPRDRERDLLMAGQSTDGTAVGLQPWSTSFGVPTREIAGEPPHPLAPVRSTCEALRDEGLGRARLGFEENSAFLPYRIAAGIVSDLSEAHFVDASGLVDDCRLVQSPLELACTREAAAVSDAMMQAAIAVAGPGVFKRDVMSAVYHALFARGGTYPGFVPLVRSTRTLEHEHGTWEDERLARRDLLFLEMSGCIRRYHAPLGRLAFIGRAPKTAQRVHDVCRGAIDQAAAAIRPGVRAGDVYRAWHRCLEDAGLHFYRRHHCGYAVGIGFPPSWSGGGVPLGLREDSDMELRAGMVFHLMSWLLRTARGDSFLSDTVVVTEDGCEVLTRAPRDLTIR
jgi:Xaa-Pro dipeptidase